MFAKLLTQIYAIRAIEETVRNGQSPSSQCLRLAGLNGLKPEAFEAFRSTKTETIEPVEVVEMIAISPAHLYA